MPPFNPYDPALQRENVTMTSIRVFYGRGEDYEAECQIINSDGEWCGYLTFTSKTLSPDYPIAGVPFRYPTPPAGDMVQAQQRAFEFWSGLVRVFRMVGYIGFDSQKAA